MAIHKEALEIHKMYLSTMENKVLDLIISNPKIFQIYISQELKTTEAYVSKIIRKLVKNKILDKDYYTKEFIIVGDF